jgi:hypothetical protein
MERVNCLCKCISNCSFSWPLARLFRGKNRCCPYHSQFSPAPPVFNDLLDCIYLYFNKSSVVMCRRAVHLADPLHGLQLLKDQLLLPRRPRPLPLPPVAASPVQQQLFQARWCNRFRSASSFFPLKVHRIKVWQEDVDHDIFKGKFCKPFPPSCPVFSWSSVSRS